MEPWHIAFALGLLALLVLSALMVLRDLRTWNNGRHRGCGSNWWRHPDASEGGTMLRCPRCGRSQLVAPFIPALSDWMRGF